MSESIWKIGYVRKIALRGIIIILPQLTTLDVRFDSRT